MNQFLYDHNGYAICVYIYIVNQRLTVPLYHNSSMWLEMQDASGWDKNLPNFMLVLVSYCSTIKVTYVSSGIITHYVLVFICLLFALPDTGALNSLEELCITWVAAINSFVRVLNLQGGCVYIVIHLYTYLTMFWVSTFQLSSRWCSYSNDGCLSSFVIQNLIQMWFKRFKLNTEDINHMELFSQTR